MHALDSTRQTTSLPTIATDTGRIAKAMQALRLARRTLDAGAPAVDLAVRLFVASVFFKSGLTKIASWSSTLSLFQNEYAVPLLPPEVAAWLGTGVELFFPVLLVLGLGSRFAAAVLFVFNIVAVMSYPDLGEVGLKDHQTWGLLLLVTLLHGPGKLSLDHLLGARRPQA
ncbi:MAG TPA: DoxX family protein [Burkholderiaceae bacterium]|nr:DoxX family protein [Burkholderiaceae bacterium]